MENNKQRFGVIIAAIAVLIMQFLMMQNTEQLQTEVSQLRNELSHTRSSMSSELAAMRSIIEQSELAERWYTEANVEFLTITRQQATVKVTWQINEYTDKDQVYFHYRLRENESFIEVQPESVGKGQYAVIFDIETPKEPIIDVNIIKDGRPYSNESGYGRVEEAACFISIDNGERVQTSEIARLDISKLQYLVFNQANLHVNIEKQNINAMWTEFPYSDLSNVYKTKNVYLENRDTNNRVIESWELVEQTYYTFPEVADNQFIEYTLDTKITTDIQNVYVRIVYEDGLVLERKLIGN